MKYKVGDEVLLKGEVTEVDNGVNYPYRIAIKDDDIGCNEWISEQILVPVTAKVKVPAWFDEWVKEQTVCKSDFESLRLIDDVLRNSVEGHKLDFQDQFIFISAIINGYEVEKEKLYRIPLPNLKTSDGYQQYLSRKSKRNGHWFASRRQSNLIQTFTKAEIEQVPEAYKQDAVEVEADENN